MKYYMPLYDHEHRGRMEDDQGNVIVIGIDCSQEGVVIEDPNPLPLKTKSGTLQLVGLFYAAEDVLTLLHHGVCVREVTVPPDATVQVAKLPKGQVIYKSNKVILGPRIDLTDDKIKELVDEGANIHVNDDLPLRQAVKRNNVSRMKALIEKGANVTAKNNEPLRSAVEMNRGGAFSELMRQGKFSPADKDAALKESIRYDHDDISDRAVTHGAKLTKDLVVKAAFNKGTGKCFSKLLGKLSNQDQKDVAAQVESHQTALEQVPEGMDPQEWTPPPPLPQDVVDLVNSKKPF